MKPRIAVPEPHSSREFTGKRLQNYTDAVKAGGGEPVVIELGLDPQAMANRIKLCDGVLLPGSPADIDPAKYDEPRHPKTAGSDETRDTADELLLQDAFNMRKPLLGICYGIQSLNVWRTGKLLQDIESPVSHQVLGAARAHVVRAEPGSRLSQIAAESGNDIRELWVNSAHHQSVSVPGDGLRVVAISPEDGIVEGVEGVARDHWVMGVQWHPERTYKEDAFSLALFRAFVAEAALWHDKLGANRQDFESVRK